MAQLLNLSKAKTDEDMAFLGFECVGMVRDLPSCRGRDGLERLWYWLKDNGESVITLDEGNGYLTIPDFAPISRDLKR